MYKVIERFLDAQDPERHVYSAGEMYPRKGYKPTEKRIEELCGKTNQMGRPVLEGKAPVKARARRTK